MKMHDKNRHVHRFATKATSLNRRSLLRAVGVGIALPTLEITQTSRARAEANESDATGTNGEAPRRALMICNNLGLLPDQFFPKASGRDYPLSPYLELLKDHRDQFTVFSGVSHPNVDGGHPSDISFLTAAPHPASSSFRNSISLDQYIAEQIGTLTRFPSLTLSVNTRMRSLSWTGSGVAIPPQDKASEVFKQLFLQGSPEQVEQRIGELETGRSILDAIADQASDLQRKASVHDRDRLDQYFSSVRDLENRLMSAKEWERKPKPIVSVSAPVDPQSPADFMMKVRLMYDLAKLAFETDSTRTITLMLDSVSAPALRIPGAMITDGYHNLSHHGKAEEKLSQLRVIDSMHMTLMSELMNNLQSVGEGNETLLDRTMILYGSNLGDANAHSTTNMPILFAGGGFKHGQHLAFDAQHNYPLPNLFVSMLQRIGIETDRFASSTGTMRGLEQA